MEYTTVAEAISAASEGQTVVLLKDVTESVTIASGKNIVLDLAGFKLTNAANKDTITIALNGTLKVTDSSEGKTGTVDNVSHARAAVYNNGTVTLEAGEYTRSQEKGASASDSGENSYYNILNHGVMTVEDGVTVQQTGHFSSLFVNGYLDYTAKDKGERTAYIAGTNQAKPVLTINGGTFSGGINTIKTDDGAETTITGGTFSNVTQAVVLNANKTTITGGTFTSEQSVIRNGADDSQYINGELTITGGTFTCGKNYYVIMPMIWYENVDVGTIDVADGLFEDKPVLGISQKAATFKENGVYIQKDLKYTGSVKIGSNQVTFEGIKIGDVPVTFSNGSVEITGSMDATEASAEITAVAGDVVLKNLTITAGNLALDNNIAVEGTLTINNGATLTVNNGATLTVNDGAKFNVEGTVKTLNTGAIDGTGKVVVQNGDISGANITAPIEDDSDESSKKTITWKDGEIDYYADGADHVISSNQVINIEGQVVLVSNSQLTIAGKLVIPAGAELIVQSDAVLKFVNGGSLVVEGTLTLEEKDSEKAGSVGGSFTLDSQSKAEISGNLTVNGIVNVEGKSKILFKQDSSVTIMSEGQLNVDGSDAVVEASAVLTVNGVLTTTSASVKNYGTVVIDSTDVWNTEVSIAMAADGAVVDVKQVTFGAATGGLTITDFGLLVYTDNTANPKVDYKVGTNVGVANVITLSATGFTAAGTENSIATISAFTVVEKVAQKVDEKDYTGTTAPYGYIQAAKKTYTNTMDLSGSLAVSSSLKDSGATGTPTVNKATLELNGNKKGIIISSENFTIGGNTTLKNIGVLTVSGTVDAIVAASAGVEQSAIDNDKKIELSGNGQIRTISAIDKDAPASVNAARYETGSGTSKLNVYVTIDNALATVNQAGNTIKSVELLGTQTVKTSATLPANVTLVMNGATLNVGDKAGSDVKLTIAKGATLKGATKIDVKGTLYAENVKDVKNASIIASDVFSQQVDEKNKVVTDGWAEWTNLTAALNGDAKLITIYRTGGNVDIAADTTVKEGVTLVVPAGKAPLKLKNGVTLTIAGTVKTSEAIEAEKEIGVKASTILNKESSAIVVSGYLMTPSKIAYGEASASTATGAPIAGAYYSIKDWSVIAPIDKAVAAAEDAITQIEINGKVSGSDVAFAAGETCKSIVFGTVVTGIPTELSVKSLTLSNGASFVISGDVSFTGSVIVGDAGVNVVGGKAVDTSNFTFTEKEGKLLLKGMIDVTDKGDSMTIANGTVVADGIYVGTDSTENTIFEVATGATLDVPEANGFVVDPPDAYTSIVVNGILNVANVSAGNVNVLTVNGALNVADATSTSSAGSIVISDLYVGVSVDDVYKAPAASSATPDATATAGVASVSGPVTVLKKAVVKSDASISEATLDSFKVDGKLVATTYVVEDKDWVTVYDLITGNTTTIIGAVNKAPVKDATFQNKWLNTDGESANNSMIGAAKCEKVTADVKYDIYKVNIIGCEGVESIAIDGNLVNGAVDLKAGQHTVTYTVANMYDGDGKLSVVKTSSSYTVATVSGMNFNVSGSAGTVDLQITGISATGYTPVPTPTPTPEKDDGLTITDYLLIVLVILIVIMAVIVAMRLMRS